MVDRAMRVIVIDEEIPFPLNTGKRIRTYNLLRRLATRHQITFLCHRNIQPDEFHAAQGHFAELGIGCILIERKLPTQSVLARGPAFYGKLATNLFSPRPYLVDKHRSSAMQRAVCDLERNGNFDLWHCEWTPYAQYFGHNVTRPLVVSAHNVESQIWERYYANETIAAKRWYIRRQWKKFLDFERWAFSRATRTVAVSNDDAQLIQRDFGSAQTDVVENGVDSDLFQCRSPERVAGRLLFVGSLDWRPNLDGIVQFIDVALPEILKREPSVELHIVGRNPPTWLIERIAQCPRAILHANVGDVRPYYDSAHAMVVPLRVGGGSRLKILESAAMKLPVVSTRIGAEGLLLHPDEHYLASNSIAEMIDPILHLLRDAARCRQMTRRALERVRSMYDWNPLADKLEAVWRHALKQPIVDNRATATATSARASCELLPN
jgi:polysaccharide biosynthesis protein PslH